MDGTEKDQGALPEGGQPSGPEAQGTSPKEPKTYTEKDVEKAVSDSKATAGRLAKENEGLKAQQTSLEEELFNTQQTLSELEKRIDDAELEKVRGDADAVDLLQERRRVRGELLKLTKEKADIDKKRAALAADKVAVDEWKQEKLVQEIASESGVPLADLMEDAKDLGLDTPEKLRKAAKRIAAAKPASAPQEEEITPDSGMTIGGTGAPTAEQMEKMTPEQYAAWRKKQDPSLIQ